MATATETLHMILTAEDRSSGIFGRVGLSIGALTAAVGALAALTKQVANVGDELDKMSIKTGETVENLSALKLAADLSDSSLGELQIGFQIMQRNLSDASRGTGEAVNALRDLNIGGKDLAAGMRNGSQFLELFARRLFQIPDPARRSQIAMDVLGRSGVQLLPLLQDLAERGMKGLRDESDRLGTTWTKQMTEASQKFNDSLTRLGATMSGMKLRFIAPLIQAFADLADKMGLGGPEAQKKMEIQARLNAIESARLQLNQQLQVAEQRRAAGVRTGIASDEIHAAMLKTANDLLGEKTRLTKELAAADTKKPATDLVDPKTAAVIKEITTAMGVLKQRADELFRAGVTPGTDEFTKMLETVRQAETIARTAFGITIPESIDKSIGETSKLIEELAKAGNVDISKIAQGLPTVLKPIEQLSTGFGSMKIAATGVTIALDESIKASGEFSQSMTNARGIVTSIAEDSRKLPTSMADWNKLIGGAAEQFRIVKGETAFVLNNLQAIEQKIIAINAQGGINVKPQQ